MQYGGGVVGAEDVHWPFLRLAVNLGSASTAAVALLWCCSAIMDACMHAAQDSRHKTKKSTENKFFHSNEVHY